MKFPLFLSFAFVSAGTTYEPKGSFKGHTRKQRERERERESKELLEKRTKVDQHIHNVAKPPGKHLTKNRAHASMYRCKYCSLCFSDLRIFCSHVKNISTQQTIGLLVEMSNVLLPLQLFWHLDPTCTENTDIVIYSQQNV